MHLNAFVELIEDDRTIAASDHCLIILVCPNPTHFRVDGPNIADLGSPERSNLLDIQVLMTFTDLVRLRAITILDIETRLDKNLEV